MAVRPVYIDKDGVRRFSNAETATMSFTPPVAQGNRATPSELVFADGWAARTSAKTLQVRGNRQGSVQHEMAAIDFSSSEILELNATNNTTQTVLLESSKACFSRKPKKDQRTALK